jgi:hypothetical protein
MLHQLLPRHADNRFEGPRIALVLFGLLLFFRTGIALSSIFNGHTAASIADGIPLDTYTPAGARTVVALFALLGLANVVIGVIGVVVLARYRSLVPLMFALFLAQQAGRFVILQALPITRIGAPPGTTVNVVILGALIVGFALSLRGPRGAPRVEASAA